MTTGSDASVIAAKSFLRGLPIAGLSAAGVLAIQSERIGLVGLTSFAINIWWASNVRTVHETNRLAFACGAALGSMLVVWLW
jgi:hypothetical protein